MIDHATLIVAAGSVAVGAAGAAYSLSIAASVNPLAIGPAIVAFGVFGVAVPVCGIWLAIHG